MGISALYFTKSPLSIYKRHFVRFEDEKKSNKNERITKRTFSIVLELILCSFAYFL